MKKLSPGIFWLLFVVVSLAIIMSKYRKGVINTLNPEYLLIILLFLACTFYTYYIDKKKKKAFAIASFVFGLVIVIPLVNFIFAIPAIYFGIKALKNIRQDKSYGGKWFAIIGIMLGCFVYITYLTGVGMCLFGFKEICKNIGLSLLG